MTQPPLGTNKFDMAEAANAPGWLAELRGEHAPETEEYGIGSFVYRARRPFHPQRLYDFLVDGWRYGYFWLASRFDQAGSWSQAGGIMNHGFAGLFWSAVPEDQWPDAMDHRAEIKSKCEPPYGDRRQEIVFIGSGIDWPALRARLDACLVPDDLAPDLDAFRNLPDPFPTWQRAEAAE